MEYLARRISSVNSELRINSSSVIEYLVYQRILRMLFITLEAVYLVSNFGGGAGSIYIVGI